MEDSEQVLNDEEEDRNMAAFIVREPRLEQIDHTHEMDTVAKYVSHPYNLRSIHHADRELVAREIAGINEGKFLYHVTGLPAAGVHTCGTPPPMCRDSGQFLKECYSRLSLVNSGCPLKSVQNSQTFQSMEFSCCMIGDMQGYSIYACKAGWIYRYEVLNSNYVQKENFKVTRVAFSSSVNQLYANC